MVNADHEAADAASLGAATADAGNVASDMSEAVDVQEGGHRNRHRDAAAAARKAPQLSSHAEWAKHEHKLPEEALAKVRLSCCFSCVKKCCSEQTLFFVLSNVKTTFSQNSQART